MLTMSSTVYYSLEEISKNNGKSNKRTWIIIKDSVYDVTEFLAKSEHPGGNEIIEEHAGKNATKDFNDVGHSFDAKNLLKQFKIGEVREGGRIGNSHNGIINNDKVNRSCMSIITCGLLK